MANNSGEIIFSREVAFAVTGGRSDLFSGRFHGVPPGCCKRISLSYSADLAEMHNAEQLIVILV
ncbi:MAG: hypothetical protein ABTQ25_11820 [Nitrosomonas ureae]